MCCRTVQAARTCSDTRSTSPTASLPSKHCGKANRRCGSAHGELEARVSERTAALAEANERLRVEIAEREDAERSRQRALIEQRDTLAFLANFSDRLAPLVTFEDLIEVVRRLPVPFLADWTMVHVVNDDGSVRFIPGVHADPEQGPLLAAVARPMPRSMLTLIWDRSSQLDDSRSSH